MKKIGILTFHASHNYGSMLQAYALQTYLMEQGHDVFIINLRPEAQKKMYARPTNIRLLTFKRIIKNILSLKITLENIKKHDLFESFIKDHMRITDVEFSNYKDLQTAIDSYNFDTLISGGDQIWNRKCKDFDLSFLLPFDGVKKISYSPSMGKQAIFMMTQPYVTDFKNYLSQYDAISVREPDAAERLQSLLNRKVEVVADPVFLLTEDHFKKLIGQPLIQEKYLFYYTPTHIVGKKAFEATKKLAVSKGCKIASSNAQGWQNGITRYNECGPVEFLNLLYYADFVCGQSFHLLAFSLIFKKDFAVINGDKDPRMINILEKCGMLDRGINRDNPDFEQMQPLDFSKSDKCITGLKEYAADYLKRNI